MIDEIKQKRKDARTSAWISGITGYLVMYLAIPVYIIFSLIGVTVFILAFGLVMFLTGMGWKQTEADCTTRIIIKQLLEDR